MLNYCNVEQLFCSAFSWIIVSNIKTVRATKLGLKCVLNTCNMLTIIPTLSIHNRLSIGTRLFHL